MIIRRYITTASILGTMAFGFTGSAFADDVTIHGTGADSTNKVEIDNSSTVEVSNKNDVNVANLNFQEAKTGKVQANENTSLGGSVGSGNASNDNGTGTTVALGNGSAAVTPVSTGGGNGGNGGTTGGSGSVNPGSGSVQGAATTNFGSGAGASVLPEVGASVPMDVSALRAAWQPQTTAPAATLAKGSVWFTNAMLLTATLLSLLGALGSIWYAKRREERIQ
jgi:hypothetical protein